MDGYQYGWRDSVGTIVSSQSAIKVTNPVLWTYLSLTPSMAAKKVELTVHHQGKPEEINFEVEQAICFGDKASLVEMTSVEDSPPMLFNAMKIHL